MFSFITVTELIPYFQKRWSVLFFYFFEGRRYWKCLHLWVYRTLWVTAPAKWQMSCRAVRKLQAERPFLTDSVWHCGMKRFVAPSALLNCDHSSLFVKAEVLHFSLSARHRQRPPTSLLSELLQLLKVSGVELCWGFLSLLVNSSTVLDVVQSCWLLPLHVLCASLAWLSILSGVFWTGLKHANCASAFLYQNVQLVEMAAVTLAFSHFQAF